jgi:hypothetical protein
VRGGTREEYQGHGGGIFRLAPRRMLGLGAATSERLEPEQVADKVRRVRSLIAAGDQRSPGAIAFAIGLRAEALAQVVTAHEEQD